MRLITVDIFYHLNSAVYTKRLNFGKTFTKYFYQKMPAKGFFDSSTFNQ